MWSGKRSVREMLIDFDWCWLPYWFYILYIKWISRPSITRFLRRFSHELKSRFSNISTDFDTRKSNISIFTLCSANFELNAHLELWLLEFKSLCFYVCSTCLASSRMKITLMKAKVGFLKYFTSMKWNSRTRFTEDSNAYSRLNIEELILATWLNKSLSKLTN